MKVGSVRQNACGENFRAAHIIRQATRANYNQELSMEGTERHLGQLMCWLAIACIMASLASCSSKPEDAIVGKWSEIDGTETLEFFKDGTVSVVDKGTTRTGDYRFIEKDRMRLQLGGLGILAGPIDVVAKVSISKDELTLTLAGGDVGKYRKVK